MYDFLSQSQNHMDIVFFVYGLAFFALGLVVFVQPKEKSRYDLARFSWLLAAFGFIHGLLEWMDLWRVVRGGSLALEQLKIVFLFVSFLFLFEFGRRLTLSLISKTVGMPLILARLLGAPIAYGAVGAGFLAVFLSIPDVLLAAQIASRYFLGFGGSLLTAIAFLSYARMAYASRAGSDVLHGARLYFILAAVSFLVYGVAGGLLAPPAEMFPASSFNDRWFLSAFHFPVQLLRMACAVLASLAVVNILRMFHREVREQLKEWADTLDERVRQRTAELEASRQEADAANRAKSAFLAAMSHEIRTPMNGVLGMVDLLCQTPLSIDQRQMLDTVHDSGYALLQLINDILDLSKIEAGRLCIEQTALSIAETVEGVTDMLAPVTAQKSLRLMSFVDPELPDQVLGDVVRLRQILFNLAGNAVKFTAGKAGGQVLIRADLAPDRGDGRTWVDFRISDNGIGMSREVMDKIFKPFIQADASTTRHFGGTGLGLAICDRLTNLMEGSIGLESEPGAGSCFTVSLPFTQVEERIEHRSYDLSGLTILCAMRQGGEHGFVTPYLEHAGAKVRVLSYAHTDQLIAALDVYGADGNHAEIVFVGAGEVPEQRRRLLERMRKHPALAGARFVMATRWNEGKAEVEVYDTVTVKTCPMRRMELLRAMAQAAGRASPDIDIGTVELLGAGLTPPSIAEAEADGELVLVAEDNETNREVLLRQLNLLGYAVELAVNGLDAFDLWKRRKYGLVLTDCHMPEMDGFELTGAIREQERDSSRRVPIVAVTANALQGEAERCLESGMDDYLAKPVELLLLKRVLDKWLPRKNGKSAIMPTLRPEAPPAPQAPEGPLDLSGLRKMVGDDPSVHKHLLKQFVEPTKRDIAAIHAASAEGNIGEAARLAHKLKSPARTVGAHQLADLCAALEEAGKQGDQSRIEALERRLDELLVPIEIWIDGL